MVYNNTNFLNTDSGAILESSSKYPDITNNAKEDFKNKRKRTNSIFQIEKHTDNKIVKGWNQMINDLTPKMSNVNPIPAQYSDTTPNQADMDDKRIQGYSNIGRRKNNVLSLPQIDISHIEFRLKFKFYSICNFRNRSTSSLNYFINFV